jgi:hypothetical protein
MPTLKVANVGNYSDFYICYLVFAVFTANKKEFTGFA